MKFGKNMILDKDVVFNFITGGLLIAASGMIAKHYSSYWSGVLYGSLPLAAYYLYFYSIYINKGEKKDGYEFINGCILGGVIWIGLVAILYPFHQYVTLKLN